MGNRRRKLLRRKFQALPWNVYGKDSTTSVAQPEQKIVKAMEDNSVMIEEPSVEMTIQPFNEPTLIAPKKTLNFKKMTKRNLLSYAKENNIAVRSTMTKTQIIKAINKS
mgnify:CR=1 FL=1